MAPRREMLPVLTSLRFVVAVAILCTHLWGVLHLVRKESLSALGQHMGVGAQFFFVLSGFILTYNYLDALRQPTRRGVWNYMVARWARVYPIHILACLAVLPLIYRGLRAGTHGDPVGIVLAHLFMVHGFQAEYGTRGNAFNPPSWSISTEWFFYLTLPLLIPGLTTGSLRRRALVLALALTPWALAVAATAGLFAMPAWVSPYRCPPVRLIDFVVGIGLGVLWRRRYPDGLSANASVRRWSLLEAAALLLAAGWGYACVRASSSDNWPLAARWVGVYLPPLVVLIWVFAHGRGVLGRALSSRPAVYLGEISPGIYLLHWSVLIYSFVYGPRIGLYSWGVWLWVATIGATVALSAACYHLYEVPVRDWLRGRLTIRKPQAPAEVPAELPARRAA